MSNTNVVRQLYTGSIALDQAKKEIRRAAIILVSCCTKDPEFKEFKFSDIVSKYERDIKIVWHIGNSYNIYCSEIQGIDDDENDEKYIFYYSRYSGNPCKDPEAIYVLVVHKCLGILIEEVMNKYPGIQRRLSCFLELH